MSTDIKPINALNASRFYEIDTGNVYMFDEEGKQWFKQRSSASGGNASGNNTSDGSSSGCFWNNPAVVEYLSAGVDVEGSILYTIDQEINAGLAVPNPDDYVPEQTLAIRFRPTEGYNGYPFAILPCRISVEEGEESENVVEYHFMTSAGSYTYTGFVSFIRHTDAETKEVYFEPGDSAEINVIKCAIPEIESH